MVQDSNGIDDIWDFPNGELNALQSVPAEKDKLIVTHHSGIAPYASSSFEGEHLSAPEPPENIVFSAKERGANSAFESYAILDAGKIDNLPELLEASGLEHCCLFMGQAFDELKYVAPWVVQLKQGNSFTRNLFTAGAAHWAYWDKATGIFVQSASSLADIWSHFRKFTKVQDERGKFFYFRFWDPFVFSDLPKCLTDASLAKILSSHRVITCLPDGTATTLAWGPFAPAGLDTAGYYDP